MPISIHVKYQLMLSDFTKISIFSTEFRKSSNKNFTKIRPVGAELFHAYRRTDRPDEANSRFS